MNQKVVLITGAAKRLGQSMALACAKAGWSVAVHYHQSKEQADTVVKDCRALGVSAHSFAADLASSQALDALFQAVVQTMGQLDAVVNNAAVFEFDDVHSFNADSFAQHISTNAMAPIALAQKLYAHVLLRQSRGVVVNLLDQKLWNMNADFFSYTLSKAMLNNAADMMARALAPQIRVVGVAPGLTLPSNSMSDAEFVALHKLSPLAQSSTPEDVAATVLFAMNNPAITGSTILVDGGQHLQAFERDFSMMQK